MGLAKKKELGQLLEIGPNSTQLNVRIPQDLYNALMRNAEKEGKTLPELVRDYLTILSFNTMLDDVLYKLRAQGLKGVGENEEALPESPPISLNERIDLIDGYFRKFTEFFEGNLKLQSVMMEAKRNWDEAKAKLNSSSVDTLGALNRER